MTHLFALNFNSGQFFNQFQGRQFDKDGNMRQWWTNKTISEYINRTQCFIKQYDEYYIPEVEEHVSAEILIYIYIKFSNI